MENFDTYEKAMNLFAEVNCVGEQNCIFVGYKDIGKNIYATGIVAGVAGIFASTVADIVMNELDEKINELNKYSGYLVNQTENGIGIIPMNGGFNSPKGMNVFMDKFVFIPNQNIEQIIVKNYSFGNKKLQLVKIKGSNKFSFQMIAFVKEKLLPYQEVCFSRFMAKYKK